MGSQVNRWACGLVAGLLALTAASGLARQSPAVDARALDSASVTASAEALKPGEYLWAPQAAPAGPMLLIVNRRSQRAVLYRNGLPIGITTVSTGRNGHETPVGVFTVLQKRERHFSNLYDNAPMPFMQRLTWDGVALHGGHLPGYPASHGCIRLPHSFAALLFAETHLGMTVAVVDGDALPVLVASASPLKDATSGTTDQLDWDPERSPTGPVSIIVSVSDSRAVVLRNGREIGSAGVRFLGTLKHPILFAYHVDPSGGRRWTQLSLPGQTGAAAIASNQFVVSDAFRRVVETVLAPGATVIVTADPLTRGEEITRLLTGDDGDRVEP